MRPAGATFGGCRSSGSVARAASSAWRAPPTWRGHPGNSAVPRRSSFARCTFRKETLQEQHRRHRPVRRRRGRRILSTDGDGPVLGPGRRIYLAQFARHHGLGSRGGRPQGASFPKASRRLSPTIRPFSTTISSQRHRRSAASTALPAIPAAPRCSTRSRALRPSRAARSPRAAACCATSATCPRPR